MKVYFYDDNKRYIGCRELKQGEVVSQNATTEPVSLTDRQEAYFEDGTWVVKDTISTPQELIPQEPNEIELLRQEQAQQSTDFQAFMDWYFSTHPEEA